MDRINIALVALLLPLHLCFPQSADELNEGSRLSYSGVTQSGSLSWWGKANRTYFIQESDNLTSWTFLPIIESGQDDVLEWAFASNSDKLFLRLAYSDIPTTDPFGDDFDNDGVSNILEVELRGTNPLEPDSLLSDDSDNDGMNDFFEIINGLDPNDPNDAGEDPDNDGFTNLEEFLNGTDPQGNNQSGGSGGGGGGNTYSGFVAIPTNDVTENVEASAEDDRVTTTTNYSATAGSTAFVLVVGIYSDEYPSFTMDGSEFNDTLDYTITPSVGSPITDTVNVNSLHSTFESDGKDFDLGEGSKFYVFPEIDVIENPTRSAFTSTLEVGATNIGDGSLPSGVTAAFFPVQIQPLASERGNVGDLILSNNGLSGGEKHFVSTKSNSSLNQSDITFEVTGVSQIIFDEFLEWEGGTAGSTSLQRKVPRASSAHTELKVKVKTTGDVVDLMNVWTLWGSISGNVQNPIAQPVNAGSGLRAGTKLSARYDATTTISPNSVFTRSDRPNLTGANASSPPGGVNVNGASLAGGVSRKFDMSRRIQITDTSNANPPLNIAVDTNSSFPNDPLIGNDDAGTGDENNTPNSSGVISSVDVPTRTLTFAGGDVGQNYNVDLQFQEFARVEINGQWYLLSDAEDWRVTFKATKEAVTESLWNIDANRDGDLADDISEAQAGLDGNGDGDRADTLSYWSNNGTTSSN